MSNGIIEIIETTPERPTAVDSDGWVYDTISGEVLGHAGAPERFVIASEDDADWALQRRSEVEAEVAKIDAQIRAVTANLQAKRAAALRRLSYWEWRFAPTLIEFARSRLTGKSRTWQGTWGRVSFRRTPGSNAIIDDEAAVAFVREWAPDRVKVVRSVTLKDVLAVKGQAEAVTGEEVSLPFVVSSPPGEAVDVRTGIETTGGKR
jgi:phage host-nuclease inhibitor protein Gam